VKNKDKVIIDLTIIEAMEIFDVYFDGIENPQDYFIEFGKWIGERYEQITNSLDGK